VLIVELTVFCHVEDLIFPDHVITTQQSKAKQCNAMQSNAMHINITQQVCVRLSRCSPRERGRAGKGESKDKREKGEGKRREEKRRGKGREGRTSAELGPVLVDVMEEVGLEDEVVGVGAGCGSGLINAKIVKAQHNDLHPTLVRKLKVLSLIFVDGHRVGGVGDHRTAGLPTHTPPVTRHALKLIPKIPYTDRLEAMKA